MFEPEDEETRQTKSKNPHNEWDILEYSTWELFFHFGIELRVGQVEFLEQELVRSVPGLDVFANSESK